MFTVIARSLLILTFLAPAALVAQKKASPGKNSDTSSGSTTTTTEPAPTTSTTTTTTTTSTTSTSTTTTTDYSSERSRTCADASYSRLVNVSTLTQLSSAMTNAQPGDKIVLADGNYAGKVKSSISGTATKPILLCGSRNAVINAGSTSASGYAIVITGSHWIVDGFTITNSQQGIRFLSGRHNVIRRLRLYQIGQEAISLKGNSSRNIVEENVIHDFGIYRPEYGEGVYVGTANSQWCTWSNCLPDRSDSNVVRLNTIGPGIGAEAVDIKEGSTGNVVANNIFNGRNSPHMLQWVVVFGNDATVRDNRAEVAPRHGYYVERVVEGWGERARFINNTGDLAGGSGYAFRVGNYPKATVNLDCSNVVTNATLGFSNVTCTK
jgi:hypothetical protein